MLKQIWDEIINYDWLAAGDRVIKSLQDGIEAAWDALSDGLTEFGTAYSATAPLMSLSTHTKTELSALRTSQAAAPADAPSTARHRSGLEYVPFDGYIAELHKGETVLTSQQAGLWRSGAVHADAFRCFLSDDGKPIRSPVLATAGAPAVSRQTAATVQTQHTTVIEMDGRTVAKVITPFVDQFLF